MSNLLGNNPKVGAIVSAVVYNSNDGLFLIVEDTNHKWWWPTGSVEANETFKEACVRKCFEETGIEINICGLLSFKLGLSMIDLNFKVVFYASPVDINQQPKSRPDSESLQAKWVSIDDFNEVYANKLRDSQPRKWFNYIVDGGEIAEY